MYKKWYRLLIILSLIAGILAKSKSVFAANTAPSNDWVDWSTHTLNTQSNPVVNWGSEFRYYLTCEDSNSGIIIKYKSAQMNSAKYYYLSKSNTAQCKRCFLENNNTITTYYTLTGHKIGSSGIIDSDFITYFPQTQNIIYVFEYTNPPSSSSTIGDENVDIFCTGSQDLYNKLANMNWQNPNIYDPSLGQMPYFYLKVVGPAGAHNTFMGDVEYTLTWDTTGSFITNQSDYYIQVYAWSGSDQNFFSNWNHKKAINNTDSSPYNMGMLAFTWSYINMERLWLMNNWSQHHFQISIRIVDANGNPVNNKWVNFGVTKMYEITSSTITTEGQDGTPNQNTEIIGQRENGVFDYTDGRPQGDNTNEDGTQNSNGSSVSPGAAQQGINNYEPTESYGNYNFGTSLKSLEETLTSMVQTIGQLPSLFSTVASFMPSWLISLIGVSIGMLVLIGVVKTLTK